MISAIITAIIATATPAAAQTAADVAAERQEAFNKVAGEALEHWGHGDVDPSDLPPLSGEAIVTSQDLVQGDWIALVTDQIPDRLEEPMCSDDQVLVIGHPVDSLPVHMQYLLDALRAYQLGAEVWYEGTLDTTNGHGYAICVPETRVMPDMGWAQARHAEIWEAIAQVSRQTRANSRAIAQLDERVTVLERQSVGLQPLLSVGLGLTGVGGELGLGPWARGGLEWRSTEWFAQAQFGAAYEGGQAGDMTFVAGTALDRLSLGMGGRVIVRDPGYDAQGRVWDAVSYQAVLQAQVPLGRQGFRLDVTGGVGPGWRADTLGTVPGMSLGGQLTYRPPRHKERPE